VSDEPARPTAGARYVLERESVDGATATYRIAIAAPDATYAGRATMREDGGVEVELVAPDELRALVTNLAILVARGAAKRRDDGLTPWPERVQRWRGPGR
jgi:hypothetical protein